MANPSPRDVQLIVLAALKADAAAAARELHNGMMCAETQEFLDDRVQAEWCMIEANNAYLDLHQRHPASKRRAARARASRPASERRATPGNASSAGSATRTGASSRSSSA